MFIQEEAQKTCDVQESGVTSETVEFWVMEHLSNRNVLCRGRTLGKSLGEQHSSSGIIIITLIIESKEKRWAGRGNKSNWRRMKNWGHTWGWDTVGRPTLRKEEELMVKEIVLLGLHNNWSLRLLFICQSPGDSLLCSFSDLWADLVVFPLVPQVQAPCLYSLCVY